MPYSLAFARLVHLVQLSFKESSDRSLKRRFSESQISETKVGRLHGSCYYEEERSGRTFAGFTGEASEISNGFD